MRLCAGARMSSLALSLFVSFSLCLFLSLLRSLTQSCFALFHLPLSFPEQMCTHFLSLSFALSLCLARTRLFNCSFSHTCIHAHAHVYTGAVHICGAGRRGHVQLFCSTISRGFSFDSILNTCLLVSRTYTHTHVRIHKHIHTHKRTHTHTYTHIHTHTHTPTPYPLAPSPITHIFRNLWV